MNNSPSALTWRYPLGSPSLRFTRFNNLVRQLGWQFDQLDTHRKRDWQRHGSIWPSSVFCLPGIFIDEPPPEYQRWAVLAYTNVNCSRVEQGLAVSDVLPTQNTLADGDQISPVSSFPYMAMWTGRASAPVGLFVCSLYVRGLNHPAESGPAIQSMRFAAQVPISYEAPFSVSPLFDRFPGLLALRYVAVAYVISDLGSCPFVGARLGFYAGGVSG